MLSYELFNPLLCQAQAVAENRSPAPCGLCFSSFFGLCSEFWFEDEKQVYLLGLKFYSTGYWPFFGPDVIYTQSQIPGALQALLVGLPFYLLPIPEAPFIFLNLLSLASLSFLAWYCTKRTPDVPGWFIWFWLLTAPWTLNYSTQVLNFSYVLTGGVLFLLEQITRRDWIS